MEDIENKYQKQGIELPENIQFQYDDTKVKREELEEIYEKKLQELNVLKQTLSETENYKFVIKRFATIVLTGSRA